MANRHVQTFASPYAENTPIGQLRVAREFITAAKAALDADIVVQRPTYWLISHGVELTLKAFLLSKGKTEDELKGSSKVRHNLTSLLNKAENGGLALSSDVAGVIRAISPAHEAFYFRYGGAKPPRDSATTNMTVPVLHDALRAAESLLSVVAAQAGEAENT